jgi:hypothetical protein
MFIKNILFLSLILCSIPAISAPLQATDHRLDCIVEHFGPFDIEAPDKTTLDNIRQADKETLSHYAQSLKEKKHCSGLIAYKNMNNTFSLFKGPKEVYVLSLDKPGKLWTTDKNRLYCEGGRMDLTDAANNLVDKYGEYVYSARCSRNPEKVMDRYLSQQIFEALQILYRAEKNQN